jgi:guanylate kinase
MREYIAFRSAARDAWKLSNWAEYLDCLDLGLRPSVAHLVWTTVTARRSPSPTRPDPHMKTGIILYGPPASGKDTITACLSDQDPRLAPFARLKIGEGRSQGYRMGTPEQLRQLEAAGDVVYRNDRYQSVYLVDRPGLDAAFAEDHIPIVHLGQIAGVTALTTGYPATWLTVQLDCPREVTLQRSTRRTR